jgi:hypothetical protein
MGRAGQKASSRNLTRTAILAHFTPNQGKPPKQAVRIGPLRLRSGGSEALGLLVVVARPFGSALAFVERWHHLVGSSPWGKARFFFVLLLPHPHVHKAPPTLGAVPLASLSAMGDRNRGSRPACG